MKKIITIAMFVAIAASCKKTPTPNEVPKQAPVLTKLVSFPDRTGVSPKNGDTLAMFDFYTGTLPDLFITHATLKIQGVGAFSPTTGLKNLFFIIKNGDGVIVYTSEKKTGVANDNLFAYLAKNLGPARSYIIIVYSDVLPSATDGVDPVDECIVSLQLTYIDANNHQGLTSLEVGQKTTFGTSTPPTPVVGTVTSNLESSTPKSKIILDGGKDTALVYGLTSSLAASTALEQTFKVQGLAASTVATLKLYDGVTLVGQAPVVSGVATIIANLALAKDIKKIFVAEVVVGSGSVSSDVTNTGFVVTLDKVKYLSGTEAKSDETDRVGYEVTVFKATLKATHISIPLILSNGVVELYKWSLTAIGGDMAYKKYTYEITLNDQGFNDTLFLKNFKIFENGADVTSSYRITDANGNIDTVFSESDTKLYLTRIPGIGESIVLFGTIQTISFSALVGGFNHPNDGDGLAIRAIGDNKSSLGLKYLNTGGVTADARLHTSPTASSSAVNFNFVCSDKTSLSHSAQFGLSSDDWFGGEKIFATLPFNIFHQ